MEQLDLLWRNGQERLVREAKGRMLESYQASRDALVEVLSAALGDRSHRPLPWYARSDEAPQRGLTGEELDKALASWALQFPDRVSN